MPPARHSAAGIVSARARANWLPFAGYVLVAGLALVFSNIMIPRFGIAAFVGLLGGLLAASIFLVVSFRHLTVPFALLILTIGGFRFLWGIQTPILPDLSLDRLALIWMVIVFMIKHVSERRPLRGPFTLDLLLLVHGLFLLTLIILHDMESFHEWTMSTMIPYAAYFLAKNIIIDKDRARSLLWVLLALSIYYNVHAVAEKYEIGFLIWPKHLTGLEAGFFGRSVGPFEHAPLFGTVIGMMLPLHLYFMATVRNRMGKILLVASFLIGLAGLYFSYTRGSWPASGPWLSRSG